MPELQLLRHPVSPDLVLRKRHSLKRDLLKSSDLTPVRIAILGGSTTAEVKSILELFLLAQGMRPEFYESEYKAYYEEAVFENPALWNFKPDVVFIHTTWHNVPVFPELLASEAEVERLLQNTMSHFETIWEKLFNGLGALIVQNNFDLPRLRPLGNLDGTELSGRISFLHRLNDRFSKYARSHPRFLLNDILYLSAQVGLANWSDYRYWYQYHMAVSPTGTVTLAQNVAAIVKSAYGKSKKCLVLDLDNTLWGGVVGDDGVKNLVLGTDHPAGESYLQFQSYAKELRRRGILLAVCSKNDLANAQEGFSHPDSVLRLEDFSAFKANWNPKPDNIREIAAELNIGLDSLVFVDDNPAERALAAAQLPEVAVPDVGSDVSLYPEILEREGYFEPARIVQDDLERAKYYTGNAQREAIQAEFANYGDFLASLDMKAEIAGFEPVYLERIAQLINKTNQFNLTTRRYTAAEVESIFRDPSFVTLYGRLSDKFGDNGLVSIIIGSAAGQTLKIDLWLMSCRVLKREMESAMFDALIEQCRERGICRIAGEYIPSKKNGVVAGHYESLGFEKDSVTPDGRSLWHYDVPANYERKSRHITNLRETSLPSHAAMPVAG